MAFAKKIRLGDLLVGKNLITGDQLQVAMGEQLDLDLILTAGLITGLYIDDAELVIAEFPLVVRVEYGHLADRLGQRLN